MDVDVGKLFKAHGSRDWGSGMPSSLSVRKICEGTRVVVGLRTRVGGGKTPRDAPQKHGLKRGF